MTSPWPQDMARGVVRELLLRRGPAPGSPGAPAAGCAVLRAGASPAGHCPASRGGTGERGGLRTRGGQKDKGADKRNGGEAGIGGQRKGGLLFFYRFIIPGLHRRKTKNRNQRAIIHVWGGGISVPRQAPEFRLWVSPASLDMPDGEINLSALGGGAGTHPRV